MKNRGEWWLRVVWWLVLVSLASCAEQRIKSQADDDLRAAHYREAVQGLDQGLKDYPGSVALRSALIQARTEASTRLLSEATAQMAQGQFDAAEALLSQARELDNGDQKAQALLQQLAIARRQQQALLQAQELVHKGQPSAALRVVNEALKDNRRHEGLQSLQRRLDMQTRQSLFQAAQAGIAEQRPVSLDFREANLKTVLDVVSRNSGVNFILDKDIRPDLRTTVLLRSAKVEEAIDLILSTNQLAKKVIDGQTLLIYPNTPDKQREHQDQVVRVFYLANAEAKNAASFLKAMIKLHEPYVDERSNMLALRDTPETIQLAERLISLFDTVEPEVLLELEVLEISSNRLTELGVQFPNTISLSPLVPAGATQLTLGNISGMTRDNVGVSVSNLLINLKRSVGDVNTLSAPKIRVKNKEKAKVLIGDKIPIVTATQGSGGFVSDSVSYIDVGLKLEVEPAVYTDDEVSIKLGLEVSSLGTQVKTASGTLAYQIGTRNAATVLRLADGQTQLLAGLISRDERTSASRVPGLGDVPVLGRLFSSQADSAQRTELVLAITPHVVRNARPPDASEAELWIGSELNQRLRPPFGRAELVDAKQAQASVPQAALASSSAASSPSAALRLASPEANTPPVPQWKGPAEVQVGDIFSLSLRLQAESPLRGAPIQVGYPKDKLSAVDVTEGSFFRKQGAATSFAKSIDPAEGRLRVGIQRQQALGASGQGDVVVIQFKALAAGAVDVTLLNLDPMGEDMPVPPPKLPLVHHLDIK